MKFRAVWLGAISLLTLSACFNSTNTRVSTLEEIDNWVQNQHYGKALSLSIERQEKQPSAATASKIKEIKKLAAAFDKSQSQAINELISDGKLNLAHLQLQRALDLYPQAPGLLAIQQRLHHTQSDEISRLQAQQLLSKGEWLLESRKVQQSLKTIKPESAGTFKDPNNDFVDTALELYHIGIKAMQNNDLKLAASCLEMSKRLYYRPLTQSALARLENLQKHEIEQQKKRKAVLQKQQDTAGKTPQNKQSRLQPAPKTQQRRDFNTLYLQTEELIKENELATAKTNIQRLKKLHPGHENIAVIESAYQSKIPEYLNTITTTANRLYISGKIQQARELWLQGLKVDPDNEKIKDSLEHADRVMQRLDELKQQNSQQSSEPE